jgi:hypothetical protein
MLCWSIALEKCEDVIRCFITLKLLRSLTLDEISPEYVFRSGGQLSLYKAVLLVE